MATALVGGIQERVEGVKRDVLVDETLAEAHHVGVVVLPCEGSRGGVMNRGGPYAGDLVGRHGDPDAGAADTDTQVGLSGHHGAADGGAIVGVVDAALVVGAEINDVEAAVGEPVGEEFLQPVSGVV